MLTMKHIDALENAIDECKEALIDNPPADFPSLKERLGFIQGMRKSLEILRTLDKGVDDDYE